MGSPEKPPESKPYTSMYGEPSSIGELLFPQAMRLPEASKTSTTPVNPYVVGNKDYKPTAKPVTPAPVPQAISGPLPANNDLYHEYMLNALRLLNPKLYGR